MKKHRNKCGRGLAPDSSVSGTYVALIHPIGSKPPPTGVLH
ncbi:hypothetical protein C4J84_4402 [Pseudomonas sp. R11-23-07]|nr:hypothetical protein C4J90_4597 [Pseudomonas sp. R2-60-08W]AZF60241.1 hypothetical protein C4J84_4402 [Pseudomonas sp. R11-23-07]